MKVADCTPCNLAEAAEALESGLLVAFPTETVYGLGADAENPEAVARIYEAKGRPSDHPVIVHLAPGADLSYWAKDIPDAAHQLTEAFWPGPLTLILKRADHIPDAVSGGQDTVGLRCPSHPVAQELLKSFKAGRGGIAAPSANKFGRVSPTKAEHVIEEFEQELGPGGLIASVLDGGQSDVGIESTIIDLSRLATHGPVLLRPGHISVDQLSTVLGVVPAMPDAAAPRASGTLESHYAPRTPVILVSPDELDQVVAVLESKGKTIALMSCHSHPELHTKAWTQLPTDPAGYAFGLYAGLRELDQASADLILVEQLPSAPAWQGVNDRLRRAAFDSRHVLGEWLS